MKYIIAIRYDNDTSLDLADNLSDMLDVIAERIPSHDTNARLNVDHFVLAACADHAHDCTAFTIDYAPYEITIRFVR